LGKYATISVLREVKELLEREKGSKDWSSFLMELEQAGRGQRSRSSSS
jgi:hypothetical protein